MPAARYDGLADWYDGLAVADADAVGAVVLDLLGPASGSLLDVGCGTGVLFETLTCAGWQVTGVDTSEDQLRLAAMRAHGLGVRLRAASALDLPFGADTFDAACLVRVLTDLDEPAAALREARRVVAPGGVVAVLTVHPCFVGPSARLEPDGSRHIFPGYRDSGWATSGPGLGDGIRSRVGTRHITLSELLVAFVAAGLEIEAAVEPGDEPLPILLGVRARV